MMWFSLLYLILIKSVYSICDDPPIDLNIATLSELQSLPFVSASSASLFTRLRPICSPLELTAAPKKIDGFTKQRLNNHWNWYSDKQCSDTCCLADASCSSNTIQTTSNAVYSWKVGPWSDCTTHCNTGTQHRDVTCFDSTHSVNNALCLFLTEPEPVTKQLCNTHKCPIYEWITEPWTMCQLFHDECVQTRDIKCYDTVDNTLQSDAKCDDKDVETTRICERSQCVASLPITGGNILAVEDMDTEREDTDTATEDMDTERDDTGTATDMDTDTSNVDVKDIKVDLNRAFNHEKCRTNLYKDVDDNTLITRRACGIAIEISGFRDNADSVSETWFRLEAVLDANEEHDAGDEWSQHYLSWFHGKLSVIIPGNGHIGKYSCTLYIQGNIAATFTLYILFNPYSSEDDVYMENSIERAEYVENEGGVVWLGSSYWNSPKEWIYDQYNFKNVETSMGLLQGLDYEYRNDTVLIARHISYAVGNFVCRGKWGSGSYTTGHPWGGYECDDNCHNPGDWDGTTMLLDIYRDLYAKYGKYYGVQYCQCWVFGGVTTTVGRSMGIPTRPLTNFQSAHDTDFNRGIEKYYILDNRTKTYSETDGYSQDSVWNFHVWNEMYFRRSDFSESEYNTVGWQVVDATPQEHSYGGNPALPSYSTANYQTAYQLGPAAKDQIKEDLNPNTCTHAPPHKKRFGCFDNEFVISEVNANYNLWVKTSDGDEFKLKGSYDDNPMNEGAYVGQLMSTRKPKATVSDTCSNEVIRDCDAERLDITSTYKYDEDVRSGPGMPTNTTNYHQVGEAGDRRRLWSRNENDTSFDDEGIDWQLDLIPREWYISPMIIADDPLEIISLYDVDRTFGMMGINIDSYFDHDVDVFCSFTVTAHDYRGDDLLDETVKEEDVNFVLNAGSNGECLFYLNYTEYEWITHEIDMIYYFKFLLSVAVYDDDAFIPYDAIIESRKVLFCSPKYKLIDRIICEKELQWIAPTHDLDYNCSVDDGVVDLAGVSDGYCDAHNNIDGCYDGGDCCRTSCVPSDKYSCEHYSCVDDRLSLNHDYYMKCDQALSFVNYMNNLTNASICEDVGKFNCSDAIWSANTGNECVDHIASAEGVFGDIEICFYQTSNSINDGMNAIIELVIGCMDDQSRNSTYSDPASKDNDETYVVEAVTIALSAVFVLLFVFFVYYLWNKKRKQAQKYNSPLLQLNEENTDVGL